MFKIIKKHYNYLNLSNTFKNGHWNSKHQQLLRYNELLKYTTNNNTIIDYGCGYGDICTSIDKDKYLGIDINDFMIKNNLVKYPDYSFLLINDIKQVPNNYDWIICSGVFTVHTSDNLFYNIIDNLLDKCNIGISFNLFESNNIYKLPKDENDDSIKYRGFDINKIYKKYNCEVINRNYQSEKNIYIKKTV